jgi:hypothetical protein
VVLVLVVGLTVGGCVVVVFSPLFFRLSVVALLHFFFFPIPMASSDISIVL